MEHTLFPKGNKLPTDWFSGEAYLTPLLAADPNNEFALGSVFFEKNARTHWHTHPKGQVLIVTEGTGTYQEQGQPARTIAKGDVVNIPADVVHWHGATKDSAMSHIAITNVKDGKNVDWLQPVNDDEFQKAQTF